MCSLCIPVFSEFQVLHFGFSFILKQFKYRLKCSSFFSILCRYHVSSVLFIEQAVFSSLQIFGSFVDFFSCLSTLNTCTLTSVIPLLLGDMPLYVRLILTTMILQDVRFSTSFCACGGQTRVSDTLKLELQKLLGIDPVSSERVVSALSY